MDRKPADHIIYKGKAALQFSLKPGSPIPFSGGRGDYTGTKKGVVFVVGARALKERNYDWENKVTIALNEHELGKFLLALKYQKPVSFFHDPDMGREDEGSRTKTLSLSLSKDKQVMFANLYEKKGTTENKIPGVAITAEEALTLIPLLETAITKVLGWN